MLDVPGGTTVWPLDPAWTSPEYPGFGRPRKPKLRPGQRRTMEQRGDELPDEAWREITVAQGSQGPRTYRFSAQRVRRATRRRKPGEELWAVWRRNLDGSEPRYYRSNAPEDTTLETLAYVGGSRWRIETEFETEKGDVGLDEYETRSWAGWHHHIAMCLLGGAFLLSLQQDWGERCPGSRGHRCTGWCVRCCPGSSSGPINCCCGWRIRSYATNGLAVPTRDAAPPAAKAGWSRHLKPVVVVLDVMSDRKIRYWIFCADFIAAVRSLVLTDELVAAAVCDLADRELLRQDPNGWRAEYLQVPFRYRPGVGSGDKGYSGRPDGNDPSAAGSHNIGAFLGIGGTPLASRSRDTLTTTKNSWRPVVGPATR